MMKAERYYTIQKTEDFNNNRHGGEAGWIISADGEFSKPVFCRTFAKALEYLSQFSEPTTK